jgi:hypothetical protein
LLQHAQLVAAGDAQVLVRSPLAICSTACRVSRSGRVWRVISTAASTPTSSASNVAMACRLRAWVLSMSRRSSWIWYSASLRLTMSAPCGHFGA